LRLRARDSKTECPLCRQALGHGDLIDCPGCGVGYHRQCFEELGGCATLGCLDKGRSHTLPEAAPEAGDGRVREPTLWALFRPAVREFRGLAEVFVFCSTPFWLILSALMFVLGATALGVAFLLCFVASAVWFWWTGRSGAS
jgi:hypothetical protein